MDMSEVYDFLLQIRRKEAAIRRKETQQSELRGCLLPSGVSYDGERVQSSSGDKMADIMARVVDLGTAIEELQHEKADLIMNVSDAIERLDDENEKTVLTEFYVGRKPIDEVAASINYSVRRTYYFRKQGVIHLAECLQLDIERQSDL